MQYTILDGECLSITITTAKELNPNHQSLYRTREGAEEALPDEAPYLFTWPHSEAFANFFPQEGWGKSWGILIKSSADFKTLYQHLRRFLTVQLEGGNQVLFRYYDPRVLRLFLPSCTTAQLREFFGPIDYFLMEDEDASFAIRFWMQEGQLQSEKVSPPEIKDETELLPSEKAKSNVTKDHDIHWYFG